MAIDYEILTEEQRIQMQEHYANIVFNLPDEEKVNYLCLLQQYYINLAVLITTQEFQAEIGAVSENKNNEFLFGPEITLLSVHVGEKMEISMENIEILEEKLKKYLQL